MRTLITGAGGLLAAAVARELGRAGEVIPLSHADLDIADGAAAARLLADTRPTVLVNCAAYNDVDGAEDQAVRALQINAIAVRTLCRAARDASVAFVHYGSDFVFDGTAGRPYREDDRPNPRGVYASSKL